MPKGSNAVDMTGRTVGELQVLRRGRSTDRGLYWWCRCLACGREVEVRGSALRDKDKPSKSCGCRSAGGHKHGEVGSLAYMSWLSMKARCLNPSSPTYRIYGGRGVTICDRWLDDFEAFLADMGPRPSARHSLDRIDSDGNYEPSNCRWATATEQARNTGRNVLWTFDGKTQSISAWAEELGMGHETLRGRVMVSGWSVEKALTTPKGKRRGPQPGSRKHLR